MPTQRRGNSLLSAPALTDEALAPHPQLQACPHRYCSSPRGPFSRGSAPLRPTLLATGAPK